MPFVTCFLFSGKTIRFRFPLPPFSPTFLPPRCFLSKRLIRQLAKRLYRKFPWQDSGWGKRCQHHLPHFSRHRFPGNGYSKDANAKTIAEDGILYRRCLALDFIRIPLQVEGSINFQMLPLMIIALRRGPAHGFIAGGIVYGLISCLKDGYGFLHLPIRLSHRLWLRLRSWLFPQAQSSRGRDFL